MVLRALGIIGALLLSSSLSAQSASPAVATFNPELRASANGVRDAAHARDLGLRRFDVSIEMRGAVTETTIDAAFANPTSDMLEGDFRLKLPAGAVVTGYALDISGTMVDGVLVDRPRAKAVYDARVRRGVDPGLAEVTPDNLFETHINPIRPHGERRIRVRFVTPLGVGGLRLPLDVAPPAEGWSIAVHATGVEAAPALSLSTHKAISFERSTDGYTAKLVGGAAALEGELRIMPAPMPDTLVSEHRSGERDVQLDGALVAPPASVLGGRLRIYWDRSRSRLSSDLDGEIGLARRLIERMHPASIELVAFNSSGAERTTAQSVDAAAAWLKALVYRGATSYAPLVHDAATDRCLLFSDGGPTIDRGISFSPPCRLDAVSSASNADEAWLRHAASSHGGTAAKLDKENGEQLADMLGGPRSGVVGVTDQDGRPLSFVPLDAGAGRWSLLARAPDGGPISVRLADAEGARTIVRSVDGPALPFDGAAALIAADTLATLGATEQRDAYVALSRRYEIASPSLSFLVLETPADYIAAKVEPPADYPTDARDTYLRMRKMQETDRAAADQRWRDQVAGEWADTVKWWKTRFDPHAQPKRVTTSVGYDQTTAGLGAPPPPPPSPAIMAPRPEISAPIAPAPPPQATALNDVVVTAQRVSGGRTGDGGQGNAEEPTDTIQIEAWQPDRPYLELYDGKPADFDQRFLEAEKRHGSLPIFYLDTAEWLRHQGRTADATEMLLSALELPTSNDVTLGIVADRLERYGAIDRAIELRERQAALDPGRPQPCRLLALALARRAALEPKGARVDLTRAVELLYGIAVTPHDDTWDGIEMIALDEANALLPKLRRAGGHVAMDPRLVQLLDVDMRVVIDWTTDGSDMDLWIDEPDHERAIYNNPRTVIGGHLSHDMTRGYGPEEYMLHAAPPGTYTVQANVYAPDRLDPNGATLLTAHLIRDYGRTTQREESVDLELKRDENGAKMIGRMIFPGGKAAN